MDKVTQLATLLDNSRNQHKAISRITLEHPELTLEDAYNICYAGIDIRKHRGEQVVGYKMGLTSLAKQKQMNVSSPIFGVLTNVMRAENKGEISMKQFIQPKTEPEIAFILGKDLHGKVSEQEAIAACSGFCAALDLIDSRYLDFKFTLIDVVADNTSAGGFVLGEMMHPASIDLSSLAMNTIVNGEVTERGVSSAILGNPIHSLMMLSEMLAARGAYLKAGDIVLSGAPTPAITLKAGLSVTNATESLGSASFSCA